MHGNVALQDLTPAMFVTPAMFAASDLYDDCQILKDMNELNVANGHKTHEETTVCGLKVPHR